MGCFQSKSTPQVVPATTASPAEAPLEKAVDGKESEQVSVARATISVGERERAELKVKNLRDKLTTTIATTEQVLVDEGRLALSFRREGRLASAKVLLQRRALLKLKLDRASGSLSTVMDMLDTLEQAADTQRFVLAVEQGTKAINDVAKDVSEDRVHDALADSHAAVAYVDDLSAMLGQHAQQADLVPDYDEAFAQLEAQLATEEPQQQPQQPEPQLAPPATVVVDQLEDEQFVEEEQVEDEQVEDDDDEQQPVHRIAEPA